MMFLVMIIVMAIIQISLWQIFPRGIRDAIIANPVLAFFVNLFGSNLILMFTGVAMLVGSANLAASVVFAGYCMWYKHERKIDKLVVEWSKIAGMKILPKVRVKYL